MTQSKQAQSLLSGVNLEFLENLFQQYQTNPGAVDPQWRQYFEEMESAPSAPNGRGGNGANGGSGANGHRTAPPAARISPTTLTLDDMEYGAALGKQSAVFQLINQYRTFGHTHATLDPLGRPHMKNAPDLSLAYFGLSEEDLDTPFSTGTLIAPPVMTLREILEKVTVTYCGNIGAEVMLLRNQEQRRWFVDRMESINNHPSYDAAIKSRILNKLTQSELFEKFLATKFVGQKRFSLEGAETLIVLMDGLVEEASSLGGEEIVIGMPHRGRLNTLVNIMEKKLEYVFAEFDDKVSEEVNELTGSGDVKYHKGYSSDLVTGAGRKMHLSMTFNPSHLEAVNPVVEGNVRAKQDRRGDAERTRIIPVLIHGDAAFAGQGLLQETLNLSQLEGYKTGGTIHIIVNNQIGFTTNPRHSRSFLYSSDVVKMLNVPVLHVNGDDPEAVLQATKLAVGFRQTFNTDVVLDMYCYRRLGHNEMDEPRFTQPLTYKLIAKHPSTLQIYRKQLVDEGTFTQEQVDQPEVEYRKKLEFALEVSRKERVKSVQDTLSGAWSGLERGRPSQIVQTVVDRDVLGRIGKAISTVPKSFNVHPRLKKLLDTRAQMATGGAPVDWGCGELLAYGSLLYDGYNVRLSGQDSGRGTFTHRHANLVDAETGADYVPLQHIREGQGVFTVHDSPLSEAGVLGFEFGYSLADPFCLTIWEAQFGDFANGAQVIIDQFISSSEEKWLRMSGLVLLLPHGFEGQGPEHSSARLERYLQMCADNNMQVCNVTNPKQFFHMMRRQMYRSFRKPLIVMSPKSLLRHPRAVSDADDLVQSRFAEVLDDPQELNPEKVRRIVFCSGKVFYDLQAEREKREQADVALVRVEQLYPFATDKVQAVLDRYANAKDVVWVQEEPKNMGAWTYIQPHIEELLGKKLPLRYIGRESSASPATGSHHVHEHEQHQIVEETLAA